MSANKTYDCRAVLQYLDSVAAGEDISDERVLEHLAGCRTCSAELAVRKRLRAELKAAVQREFPRPGLANRIRARVRDQEHRARTPWNSNSIMLLAGVAVGVFVAAVLVLQTPPELADFSQDVFVRAVRFRVASAFRVGLSNHLHCTWFGDYAGDEPSEQELAEELGTEFAPILPLVQERLPKDFRIVAAHLCDYEGREFVHVALRNRGRLLSVVITEKLQGESFPAGTGLQNASAHGFQIAGFETAGRLVYLVSDLEPEQNRELFRAMAPDLGRFLGSIKG